MKHFTLFEDAQKVNVSDETGSDMHGRISVSILLDNFSWQSKDGEFSFFLSHVDVIDSRIKDGHIIIIIIIIMAENNISSNQTSLWTWRDFSKSFETRFIFSIAEKMKTEKKKGIKLLASFSMMTMSTGWRSILFSTDNFDAYPISFLELQ